jgi:hypothetical protein
MRQGARRELSASRLGREACHPAVRAVSASFGELQPTPPCPFSHRGVDVKRSELTDEEFGRVLVARYDALAAAHAAGLIDEHPSESFNRGAADLRRAARDGLPGNVGEAKEIEPDDHTADDPPRTEGTPAAHGMPDRPGAAARDRRLAADEAREELAIRLSGAPDVEARLQLARARRSDPNRVRAMDRAIPGYGRLK